MMKILVRRKSILLFLLAISLLLVACYGRQPQIAVETEQILLGDVVNGEVVVREVTIWNEGKATLVVEALSTSCGCTQASLDPMTIPPGGSAQLKVEFDSAAHGEELTGRLMRQIFIASNDPQQPELVLELVANILARATPEQH